MKSSPHTFSLLFPKWVVPLILIFSILTVWLRLSIVKSTYTINQTEKMISNLKQEKERSSLKTAGLKSPRRLELLSKTKFQLKQPKTNQVVFVQ